MFKSVPNFKLSRRTLKFKVMDFNILLPFKTPLNILKSFEFWQTKDSSWRYFVYGIVMYLIFFDVFTVLQLGYLFIMETFEDFANLMSLLPTFIAGIIKSLNWLYKLTEIEELMIKKKT